MARKGDSAPLNFGYQINTNERKLSISISPRLSEGQTIDDINLITTQYVVMVIAFGKAEVKGPPAQRLYVVDSIGSVDFEIESTTQDESEVAFEIELLKDNFPWETFQIGNKSLIN